METFIVRLFVADDLDGLNGTIERPGGWPVAFHGAEELIGRLVARDLDPGRGRITEGEAATVEELPIVERLR